MLCRCDGKAAVGALQHFLTTPMLFLVTLLLFYSLPVHSCASSSLRAAPGYPKRSTPGHPAGIGRQGTVYLLVALETQNLCISCPVGSDG